MPGRPLFVPHELSDALTRRLRRALRKVADAFPSGAADENTLTGHLGFALKMKSRPIVVSIDGTPSKWTWSIDYYRLRSAPKDAPERWIGADGLFELIVHGPNETTAKTLLFQAKKLWIEHDARLLRQAIRLITWKEAAVVINYTPQRQAVYSIDDVLRARGDKRALNHQGEDLAVVLGTDFLACAIGHTDLRYDWKTERLLWKNRGGDIVVASFAPKHRFRISVRQKRPKWPTEWERAASQPPLAFSDISTHRLATTNAELLGLPSRALTRTEVSKACKQRQRVVHLDGHAAHALPKAEQNILTSESARYNIARDELLADLKRR